MAIRVLALCGFTQNAHIYSKQLGAIRKTLKDVEFVFLEPPIVVEKVDMPWNQNMSDFDSSATTEAEEQTPETTPRAWWLSSADKTEYRRWEETERYLNDHLRSNPPYDGVMGFSQGGCMAAILAGLLEKPDWSPLFAAEPRIPPFKSIIPTDVDPLSLTQLERNAGSCIVMISVGGFLPVPKTPDLSSLFPLPAHLPTLHIMGRNDVVVAPERSQTLIDACEGDKKRVELHDGGHFTPSKASWRHFLNAYITAVSQGQSGVELPPPSAYGPSAANTPSQSGAATPARSGSPGPSPLNKL